MPRYIDRTGLADDERELIETIRNGKDPGGLLTLAVSEIVSRLNGSGSPAQS